MSDSAVDFVTGCTLAVVSLVLLIPIALLFGLAWNGVAPALRWPPLDYWQGLALLVVVRLLLPPRAIRVRDPR